MDELPEFKRTVLEVMRQPMEKRILTISRSRLSVDYPVGTGGEHEPPSVGVLQPPDTDCSCMPGIVQRYLNNISGPLLDPIDIHVEVVPVPFQELSNMTISEKGKVHPGAGDQGQAGAGGAVQRSEGDLLQCADDEQAIKKHLPDRPDGSHPFEECYGEVEFIGAGI